MIRNAKSIAIQDLSFWAQALPLLSGLPRILDGYTQELTPRILMTIDIETGADLHRQTLQEFVRQFNEFDRSAEEAARDRLGPPVWYSIKFGARGGHRQILPALSPTPGLSTLLARSMLDLVFNDRDLARLGSPDDESIDVHLQVPGCGSVGGGQIDLATRARLVELKLTANPVGLRDIRQVLTYAGLLRICDLEVPSAGAVVNPRLGAVTQFDFEELLLLTGGLSLEGFADQLADHLARESVSR